MRQLKGTAGLMVAAAAVTGLFGAANAAADGYRSSWGESARLQLEGGGDVPGGCPIESPTGRFLFTAQRPSGDLDILVADRAESGQFQAAAPLPGPANDESADDFCPTPLEDGELYFVSSRDSGTPDGCGAADMYVTVNNPATGWQTPVNLGCDPYGPNTPGVEFSPSIVETAFGTYLFFSTNHYTGNQDIYWSWQRPDGSFSPGFRLPYPINTEHDDRQPNVSRDGREIVFASDRRTGDGQFDIFYAKKRWLFSRWRRTTNLSESVPFPSLDLSETRPSISWDDHRLVYGAGGVWQSER